MVVLEEQPIEMHIIFPMMGLNDWNDGAITIDQWIDYLDVIQNQYGQIGRLTIFAHGSSGSLKMSDAFRLETDDLKNDTTTRNEIMRLRNILSSDAHILIFSCNVGKNGLLNTDGTDFVQELANLTGATVHANDDYTGSEENSKWYKTVDWSLEVVATPDQ